MNLITVLVEMHVTESSWEDKRAFVVNLHDVTASRHAEQVLLASREQERLAVRILKILNRSAKNVDIIRQIILEIKDFSGMEAVGIRLKEGEDYPYYATNGFPDDFVEAERYLCARDPQGEIICDISGNPVLECMCGNVICGRTDPLFPFFTEDGSSGATAPPIF